MTEEKAGLPVLTFASADDWGNWLARQPSAAKGLWLKLARKSAQAKSISRQQAIETALCHGWIDGQLDRYDEAWWLVRFTPRSPKSRWSEINRSAALRLLAQGRMRPAGQAQIDAAKADGRWDAAYAPQSKATVPADLQSALDASPAAKHLFVQLNGANRYAILYRVHDAKTAKTRAQRIEKFVAMLELGEVIHPAKAGSKASG
ncbi:MAG: hypothetical protein EPN77_19150 [Candidimonas sp.]|nr:MAG: hypothetical protein EPN77_19150 [Candidimonas sp.]TBR77598.1 MAG: hypothetical protein EPN64_01705 [Burkholderiaceae bacterium]